MLDDRKINQIAKRVATANLSSQNFTSVTSSSTTDSAGNEALQITIVIKPGAESKITGDAALKTLVQMQDKLRRAGEDRFPIIEYATKKELAESGDS
jgi:outer membrane protein assembly factor BamA